MSHFFSLKVFLFPIILFCLIFVFACSQDNEDVCIITLSGGERSIALHFPSITLRAFDNGADLLQDLEEGRFLVDKKSTQTLSHPDFPTSKEETRVSVVVRSLLSMGFPANELISYKEILEKGKDLGLMVCPPDLAAQLRLQFTDQSSHGWLGDFLIATEEINLHTDGIPGIFAVVRDDSSPHPETGIGLHLVFYNLVRGGQNQLFDPRNSEKNIYCGKFAFIAPVDNLIFEE